MGRAGEAGRGEGDPLQSPRPPERTRSSGAGPVNRCHEQATHNNNIDGKRFVWYRGAVRFPPIVDVSEWSLQNFIYRAKRLSARLSGRASLVWWGGAGEEEAPPPVPRHRTDTKYNTSVSDSNHIRLPEKRTKVR